MKPEIKKLLILNLPYLLFVWLFDKVGAAVRLSPGADASAKLLHLGDGFTTAFSSIAPSFHPADLLIGIAGAVIVRLIIYTKGKNAKKYRRGTEYGSARWGGADDIKPYTDPVFENNIRRLHSAACALWYQPVRVYPASHTESDHTPHCHRFPGQ